MMLLRAKISQKKHSVCYGSSRLHPYPRALSVHLNFDAFSLYWLRCFYMLDWLLWIAGSKK